MPELQAVLDATPSEHLTFLAAGFGKPFAVAGFTNWFRETCNAAGVGAWIAQGGMPPLR